MTESTLQETLNRLGGGAVISISASPAVAQAERYLSAEISGKPVQYQSRYEDQIASLYEQIMNRPRFSYDVNRDPLYQQYREQYIREGKRAMQDAAGISAALTGGYGNSWAGTAGYQAYAQYLQALNDKLPELESRAQERYKAEGDALQNNMDLMLNLDNREYGWYRDAMDDWQFDAKLALEQAKFDFEVQKYREQMMGLLGSSYGGGGGGGRSGGGSSKKSSGKTAATETTDSQELVYPVLPENVKEKATNPNAPAVLAETSSVGFTPQQWADTQARLQELSQSSFQTQAKQAAQTASSLTSMMVNAAQQGLVRSAVENSQKKKTGK